VRAGTFSFRNPPQFMDGGVQVRAFPSPSEAGRRPAQNENDALIDHLFEHPNTPPFIALRLIQRFVSSNPSPRYVKAVATAFKTGTYSNGLTTTFGVGVFGDLAATIAAVLLDPEARSTTLDADPTHGKLREPLLKVVHFLRAMEYRPHRGRELALFAMDTQIGQGPFQSPSVFNFYTPDYQPAELIDDGLSSPESKLGTAPFVVNYLNGMSSLIDVGLTSCRSGFGDSFAQPNRFCWEYSIGGAMTQAVRSTADGNLSFTPSLGMGSSSEAVVEELDLLLTNGRMGNISKKVIIDAHADTLISGTAEDALRLAQKLAMIAPEFHATNNKVDTGALRPEPVAQMSGGRPFKAIVVVNMQGGADSFNMLVPHSNCSGGAVDLFGQYTTIRTNTALAKGRLLPIQAPAGTQPCTTFGLHPELGFLQSLYDDGDAAWVANVGTLTHPLTTAEYKSGSPKTPPGLFGHNIQQTSVQSVHAQVPAASGLLGRAIAALLTQASPYKSYLFSLVGNTKFLEGSLPPVIVSPLRGIARFSGFSSLAPYLTALTQPEVHSKFADLYSATLDASLRMTEQYGAVLASATLSTSGFGTDDFGKQMTQVARLLKIRTDLHAERAVFVTNLNGFDTHSDLDTGGGVMAAKLQSMGRGIGPFVAEMKAQGIWDSVTVVAVSEFGRTLTSNGQGTDHGCEWLVQQVTCIYALSIIYIL
jgi:cullin-associated NEDD8-dissociated protein 1